MIQMTKKRDSIGSLYDRAGEDVNIAGWVENVRDLKTMQFVTVRDNTGIVQVTNEKTGSYLDDAISSLTPDSTVTVQGKIIRNEGVKLGQMEIKLKDLEVHSYAQKPLPTDENSPLENRLDWRFVDLRKKKNNLIFSIQTTAEHAMRNYWLDNGFIEIHSPKLVEGASESGAELFQLYYFDRRASLAQSPQFYKQMAMAAGFERVFEIGPVFRANTSYTRRHDTEFTSVDVEISWIDSHKDIMDFEERWLQYVLGEVEAKHGKEIKDSFNIEVKVPVVPFPRVSMKEAYKILEKAGHETCRDEKGDLDPEGERRISKYISDNFNHEFVFVEDYPITARPFYHMRYHDSPDTTKSFDLIWKGLEVTTGAQREHRYEKLLSQAKEKNVDVKSINHYLNFFKYGCPPHGGYGFGLTRMLMVLLGAQNVREVTYVYRGPNRLTP